MTRGNIPNFPALGYSECRLKSNLDNYSLTGTLESEHWFQTCTIIVIIVIIIIEALNKCLSVHCESGLEPRIMFGFFFLIYWFHTYWWNFSCWNKILYINNLKKGIIFIWPIIDFKDLSLRLVVPRQNHHGVMVCLRKYVQFLVFGKQLTKEDYHRNNSRTR